MMKYIPKILPLWLFLSLLLCTREQPEGFVDILSVDSTFVLDVRYATPNNFTHQVVYPCAKIVLRKTVAESLVAVQHELRSIGLGLKVFDGYRPLSVQKRFWEILPDSRYVADPKQGSRHNRGAAVDVTLVDSTGTELEMPTEFDDFTERSHSDSKECTEIAKNNRIVLQQMMQKHGFQPIRSEWWHFDFKGWEKYEIMDVPLNEIQ